MVTILLHDARLQVNSVNGTVQTNRWTMQANSGAVQHGHSSSKQGLLQVSRDTVQVNKGYNKNKMGTVKANRGSVHKKATSNTGDPCTAKSARGIA